MKKTTILKLLGALALVVAVAVGCNRESVQEEQLATELLPSKLITYSSNVIPGQYIVVMNEEHLSAGTRAAVTYEERQQVMREESKSVLRKHAIATEKIQHVYGVALQGFSLSNVTENDVQKLLADPAVKYIEQDQTISLQGGPPSGGGSCANNNSEMTPCGIPLVNGGANHTGSRKAYVIDTGIDLDHPDLNVANYGFNAFTSGKDAGAPNDGNGHGSHVAGTIAAIGGNGIGVVGVAAGALVVPVKVLDSRGSGSNSGVIAGVDYVGANGTAGDVANMSLGGGVSTALDAAVLSASNSNGGIWFVIAAGNSSANANNYSPARVNGPYVRTIASMTCAGAWASYSNYGMPPIDYIAPGSGICSTYKDGGYASLNGTSMACPHAAGVILAATNGNPSTCGNLNYNGTSYPKICI